MMKKKPSNSVAKTRTRFPLGGGKIGKLLRELTPDLGPKQFLSKVEMVALRYAHKIFNAEHPNVMEVTLMGEPVQPHKLLSVTPTTLMEKMDEALFGIDSDQIDLRLTAAGVVLPHLIGAGRHKGQFTMCLHALVATRSMDLENLNETLDSDLPKYVNGCGYDVLDQPKKRKLATSYRDMTLDVYSLPDGPMEVLEYGQGPLIGRVLRRDEWDSGVLQAWRRKYRTERLYAYEASY